MSVMRNKNAILMEMDPQSPPQFLTVCSIIFAFQRLFPMISSSQVLQMQPSLVPVVPSSCFLIYHCIILIYLGYLPLIPHFKHPRFQVPAFLVRKFHAFIHFHVSQVPCFLIRNFSIIPSFPCYLDPASPSNLVSQDPCFVIPTCQICVLLNIQSISYENVFSPHIYQKVSRSSRNGFLLEKALWL